MKEHCTLVEFCGIPYSWKTTTMGEVERLLRSAGVPVLSIQERDGVDPGFYERRKITSDVNVVRSLRFLADFIEASSDTKPVVILVDRGPFDALCWTHWFSLQPNSTSSNERLVTEIFESTKLFADKYRVVWMDRDPLQALRSHGAQPGRIVNFQNLVSLRNVYEQMFTKHRGPDFSGLHINSDDGTSQLIGMHLVQQLKLIRVGGSS